MVHEESGSDTEREDWNRDETPCFDQDTLDVLELEFPPYFFSTHGLSRPSTPEPDQKER